MSGPGSAGQGGPVAGGPSGPPGDGPAPGLEYGTVGVRLVAYIIDVVILGAMSGAARGLLGLGWLSWGGMEWPGANGFDGFFGWGALSAAWFAWVLITAAISGLYFVGLWTRNAASLGQMLLGLEVRNAADGARPTQDQAIRRWAFLTVPVISSIPALGLLVFLYQLYLLISTSSDPAKQGFHDRQAETVVVRRAS